MSTSTDLPVNKIGESIGEVQLDCGFSLAILSEPIFYIMFQSLSLWEIQLDSLDLKKF
jgi:hypothetical protein